jgi:hypothetical protein
VATEDAQRKLEEIYSAALQQDINQRADFVRDACGDDDDLRREVESLLGYEEKLGSFLGKPAFEVPAGG